jgi:hypothetical protein
MRELGALDGDGHLVLHDGMRAQVRYRIEVTEEEVGGLKSAGGNIAGEASAIYAAFNQGAFTIELATGETVQAIITHTGLEGRAEIVISGPVPGF